MAETSKGGWSRDATTSSARTRPRACFQRDILGFQYLDTGQHGGARLGHAYKALLGRLGCPVARYSPLYRTLAETLSPGRPTCPPIAAPRSFRCSCCSTRRRPGAAGRSAYGLCRCLTDRQPEDGRRCLQGQDGGRASPSPSALPPLLPARSNRARRRTSSCRPIRTGWIICKRPVLSRTRRAKTCSAISWCWWRRPSTEPCAPRIAPHLIWQARWATASSRWPILPPCRPGNTARPR